MNKVMSSIVAVVAMLAMTLGVPAWVTATPIVDQQNVIAIVPNNYQTDMSSQQTLGTFSQFAQTFTVGVAGTLVQVDVEVYHGAFTNGNATVDLLTTTGTGVPGSSGLASWSITNAGSSSTVGSFVSLNFGGITVSPGQIYAIEFTWSPPSGQTFSGFNWVSGVSDTYAGGSAFSSNFGASPTPWTSNAYDYGFRTWVEPSAGVPEPSTMLLLGGGMVGLLGVRRKSKK